METTSIEKREEIILKNTPSTQTRTTPLSARHVPNPNTSKWEIFFPPSACSAMNRTSAPYERIRIYLLHIQYFTQRMRQSDGDESKHANF